MSAGIEAILTDIEGTTSSIAFVRDVLFPYSRERLPDFIEVHADDPEVRRCLREVAREAGAAEDGDRRVVLETLLRWIEEDRKATPLKALQGMIWKDGYQRGAYRAHLYPEVAAKLREWKARGLRLYVYSSGSVQAQKLFFGYSEAGDLLPLFDGFFDTEIGGKRERGAYLRIAEAIGLTPDRLMFLSDIEAELDAARGAGMRTAQVCRPPERCRPDAKHPCVTDFGSIVI
ncbi:MAG TPA: acireductone synthase [Rhodanobacteraceae bacterium]